MSGEFFNGANLAEILSGIAIPAGAALMYRHGRLGGPLGAALTGFGGLGLALGERQHQQAQQQAMSDWLTKVMSPQQLPVGQAGPPSPPPTARQAMEMAAKMNVPADQAVGILDKMGMFPKTKDFTPQLFTKAGGGYEYLTPGQSVPTGDVPFEKTPKESNKVPSNYEQAAYTAWLATHPNDIPGATLAMERAKQQEYQAQRDIALATRPPEKPEKVTYGSAYDASGEITGRIPSNTGIPEPLPAGAAGKFYRSATKPKDKTATPSFGEAPEKIAGANYKRVSAKGDPMTGILTLADAEPLLGKAKPKFLWKIDNKVIDPNTLSEADAKKYAEKLYKKGLTIDQIFPGMK